MNREIVTDPLLPEDLWADLKKNIETLLGLGVSEVLVLYGFSWGAHFYEDKWYDLPVRLTDIEGILVKAMEDGNGALGHDNLYISVPQYDLKLLYSHETDIHLSFGEKNSFVTKITNRWKDNGWLHYGRK